MPPCIGDAVGEPPAATAIAAAARAAAGAAAEPPLCGALPAPSVCCSALQALTFAGDQVVEEHLRLAGRAALPLIPPALLVAAIAEADVTPARRFV